MKKSFITLVVLLFSLYAGAQQTLYFNTCCPKEETGRPSRVRFYGGFGLGISNNGFYLDLQPGLMYRIKPGFYAGSNLQLTYQSVRNYGLRSRYYVYGADALLAYLPWRYLELSVDYQYLFVRKSVGNTSTRWEVPAFYLGAGYRTRNVVIGLRYDLLYDANKSIYPSAFTPYIRIYF